MAFLAMSTKQSWFATGIFFAILWPSASTATKLALSSGQPLVVACCRFAIAACIMLFIAHVIRRKRLPRREEWKQLAIYGLLNISVYLGLYVIAMEEVTASIGALTVAASPVFISFLSFILLKKPISVPILLALLICISGFVVVAWPLIGAATVTVRGLSLLIVSMFSYSIGTIYFSSKQWNGLHLLTINGWQTLMGGLFLLPFMFFTYQSSANHFNYNFWMGTIWLALPVSIVAVLLWLKLIQQDPVKAGLWLFLCPVFGILIAVLLMKDKISAFTVAGVLLVLLGLAISHYGKRKFSIPFRRYIFRN
ncbi:DMT family transporter [Niabella insulamsoli]|uniref:DMT family transporter n=1 Tax=Niabella insulamsoli TaxID=3144874 RepID=UPI0031FCF6F6